MPDEERSPGSRVDAAWARAVGVARRLGLSGRGWALVGLSLAAATWSTLVLVAVGQDVIAGDGLERRDASLLSAVVAHRTPTMVGAARAFTNVGSVAVLVPLAAVAALVLWWRGARLVLALAPALSLAVTGVVVASVKALVGRPRPAAALRLATEGDASFPSGHASDSAGFYLVLAVVVAVVVLRRPLARAAAVAAAFVIEAAIALSRLALGVHWPTDVIVGSALGTTVALLVSTAVVLLAHAATVPPGEDDGRRARFVAGLWRLAHLERPRSASPRQGSSPEYA